MSIMVKAPSSCWMMGVVYSVPITDMMSKRSRRFSFLKACMYASAASRMFCRFSASTACAGGVYVSVERVFTSTKRMVVSFSSMQTMSSSAFLCLQLRCRMYHPFSSRNLAAMSSPHFPSSLCCAIFRGWVGV